MTKTRNQLLKRILLILAISLMISGNLAQEANITEANATEANATEVNATEANATEANATEANATEANATETNATANATETNATANATQTNTTANATQTNTTANATQTNITVSKTNTTNTTNSTNATAMTPEAIEAMNKLSSIPAPSNTTSVTDISSLAATLLTALGKNQTVVTVNQTLLEEQQNQQREAILKARQSTAQPVLECKNDTCNNQGTCSVGSGRLICACNAGSKGQQCQMSETLFNSAQTLITNVASALGSKNITVAEVASVASTLQQLTVEPDTVSVTAASSIADAIGNAASAFAGTGGSKPTDAVTTSLLGAIDNLFNVVSTQAVVSTNQDKAKIQETINKVIQHSKNLLGAIASNLNIVTKEKKTVSSNNFVAQLGFPNATSNSSSSLRRLATDYVTFSSTSGSITTTVRILSSELSSYNVSNITYKSQVWYTNNREFIDSSKKVATLIVESGLYNVSSKEIINLNMTSQNIEVDVPLLTAGKADSNYQCLIWDETSKNWNTQICTQKVATTSMVTCKCSKLGEVAAALIVPSEPATTTSVKDSAINIKMAFTGLLVLIGLIAYN